MAPQPRTQRQRARSVTLVLGGLVLASCTAAEAPTRDAVAEELCLVGALDLGARFQGRRPAAGELHPTRWCVVTSPNDDRVRSFVAGRSNPDVDGAFTLAYLAPDRVRIVNADDPPDVEFRGTTAGDEARSVARLDPRWLVAELSAHPEWVVAERNGWQEVRWPEAQGVAEVQIRDGRLTTVRATADLPLRGRVPVIWSWDIDPDGTEDSVRVTVDGEVVFRGGVERRELTPPEADGLWRPSGSEPVVEVPGRVWPAVIRMGVETLEPGVHIVRGVRTGFHHLVVETDSGLVVVDAPAGWVELHRIPPTDLVPGLGVSGLSERFVDYLRRQWPGVPIRAVILTHAHDDHAGGARAFAATGARVYAPSEVAGFLEEALNRETMPEDRFSLTGERLRVVPIEERTTLADPERPVEVIPTGRTPHVDAAVGVYVPSAGVLFQSDLLVPVDDAPSPRPDRIESDCWFAEWVSEGLPPETVVHNSHNATTVSVGAIAQYLGAPRCTGRP